MRIPVATLVVAGSLCVAGCGYGYGGYGVGLGYGDYYGGGYYGGYGGYGYSPYDYGGWYGDPYFGWYDGGYYPGVGVYVYDQYRRPHRWSGDQERYWTQRRDTVMRTSTTRSRTTPTFRENWSGFNRRNRHPH